MGEDRGNAACEREETQEEKLSYLETSSKEAIVRAELAERNCGVVERTIVEISTEIAMWKEKLKKIEDELVEMDNIADSPEADLSTCRGKPAAPFDSSFTPEVAKVSEEAAPAPEPEPAPEPAAAPAPEPEPEPTPAPEPEPEAEPEPAPAPAPVLTRPPESDDEES